VTPVLPSEPPATSELLHAAAADLSATVGDPTADADDADAADGRRRKSDIAVVFHRSFHLRNLRNLRSLLCAGIG
jgi:hypothetical protein